MKVKCKIYKLQDLEDASASERLSKYLGGADGEIDLEVGDIYTVYGVEFWENNPWYYLCADGVEYPKPYPNVFFEIVDKRLSKHWVLNSEVGRSGDTHTSLVIKEWAADRSFYERAIDGDKEALGLFNFSRKVMDME